MSAEVKCGNLWLKLDLGEPSETAQQKALQELRETPENIQNGLRELKRLLEAETDLNIPKMDEEWLMKFLRSCKFYPESARDLIRRYYTMRRKYSEITKLLTPTKLKHIFDANLVTLLPQRDQENRRIIVTVSAGKSWNHKIISHDDIYAGSTLCTELIQLEQETQINGVMYIVDLKDLSIGQALQFTPYRMKRTLDYIQNNIPLRVKGLHIVNQPKIFEPIFAAVKLFFIKKFNERILVHGTNYASLHRYISPECLPECYGGTLKTKLMYSQETYELLSHYEKYLQGLEQYGFRSDLKC